MTDVATFISQHPFFDGVDPRIVEPVVATAHPVDVSGGRRLFYQGDPAMNLYLIHSGAFSLRAQGFDRAVAVVDQARAGEVVGWSWMVAPYRWMFDAVAIQDSAVLAIDAGTLRMQCDTHPEVGYHVMKRIAETMHHRLSGARERLLESRRRHG